MGQGGDWEQKSWYSHGTVIHMYMLFKYVGAKKKMRIVILKN